MDDQDKRYEDFLETEIAADRIRADSEKCDKEGCYARRDNKCAVLTSTYPGRACPFYKTKDQYREGIEKYRRI